MKLVTVPNALINARGINCYSDQGLALKETFHRKGKQLMKELADALGLERGEFEIRSNLGGLAVSGEVTLHADHLYVQLSESAMAPGIQMLYRSCSSRKDYCGDRNHFIQLINFAFPDSQITALTTMKRLIESKREQVHAEAAVA